MIKKQGQMLTMLRNETKEQQKMLLEADWNMKRAELDGTIGVQHRLIADELQERMKAADGESKGKETKDVSCKLTR